MAAARFLAVALGAVLAVGAASQDVNGTSIATPDLNITAATNSTNTPRPILLSSGVGSSSIASANECPNVPNSVLLAGPSCVCAIGYTGTPTFDGTQWTGVCSRMARMPMIIVISVYRPPFTAVHQYAYAYILCVIFMYIMYMYMLCVLYRSICTYLYNLYVY